MRHKLAVVWANLPLRTKGLVVVAIPLLSLVVAMSSLSIVQQQQQQAETRVRRTLQVRDKIQQLQTMLLSEETWARTFLMARVQGGIGSADIAPVSGAFAGSVPKEKVLKELQSLLRESPTQLDRLRRVNDLVDQELLALAYAVAESPASQPSQGTVLPRNLDGFLTKSQVALNEIYLQLGYMLDEEDRNLAQGTEQTRRASRWALTAIVGSAVFGLGGGILAVLLFTAGVVQRVQRSEQNARRLAQSVPMLATPEGRDEIGRLGEALEETQVLLVEREEALKRAKDEAQRANQAKSEFLSRMSHELRTPLNAILGFGQLLEMNPLSPDQRVTVGHILKGGRHLLALINEVLEITRIETGRLSLSPEPVQARQVIQESLDLIAPLAATQHIRLDGTLHEACNCFVLADWQRFKQVLLNVLSNAVKYNRPGGSVRVACESPLPGRLRIRISDTGRGIPPDKLGRLFTPFDRLGAEATTVEGTGIGLALSKVLMQLMGGTIGVESTVGEGSTFWVELAETVRPSETRREEMSVGSPESGVDGRAKTVLYIEDNLSNVQLIESIFATRPGVKVLPAMQGQLGLELAHEHHPDLILLDMRLPDILGEEVLRRLQDDRATRTIPVVVITADATPGQSDRLLASGAKGYLTKPLDVKRFLEIVTGILEKE